DHLDWEREQRAQGLAQFIVGEPWIEVAEPTGRTHAQTPRTVTEEPVARNEGARAREPDHGLPCARDGHGLHPRGKRVLRPGCRRVEAPHDLVPAAAVKADCREHANRLAVSPNALLQGRPELVR